jgi:hypothetical protein
MSTKKSSTKDRRGISARLRKRAEAIINSTAYEQDTREAIAHILKQGDPAELAKYVRQAEEGDHICDLTLETQKDTQAARRTLAYLNSGIPGFLRDAIIDAITKAGMKARIKTPDHFAQSASAQKQLADLFALTGGNFTLALNPRAQVAAHLAALLDNPDHVPTELYNALADEVTTLVDKQIDMHSPELIERALEGHDLQEFGQVRN